jgi:hypothetical protein
MWTFFGPTAIVSTVANEAGQKLSKMSLANKMNDMRDSIIYQIERVRSRQEQRRKEELRHQAELVDRLQQALQKEKIMSKNT